MTNVRTCFLAFLFLAGGLFAGCGSSDGTIYVPQSNTPIQISTGEVRLLTNLQGVQAQAELSTGDTVPVAVTDFRVTGFDANGTLIFAVVKPKAATVVLSNVPVQVTNIRIELLVGGLPIGGVSVPVTVVAGETTTIDRPTFTLLDGGEGTAPVYGSFVDCTVDEETGVLDFATTLVSEGVTRIAPGVYEVSREGDYLVSYNMSLYRSLVFEVLDGQSIPVNFISFVEDWVDDPAFTFVVSLDPANDRGRVRLRFDSVFDDCSECEDLSISSTFAIVRIGPSTGSSLPDNVIEDNGDGPG